MRRLWTKRAGTGTSRAGLMYYFDPERGQRRRQRLKNRIGYEGPVEDRIEDALGERVAEHVDNRLSDRLGERVAEHLDNRLSGRLGQRLSERIGDRIEFNEHLGDRIGDRIGERISNRIENRLEARVAANLGERFGERLSGRFGERLGGFFGNRLGQRASARIGERFGVSERIGGRIGNRAGNRIANRFGNRIEARLGEHLSEGIDNRLGEGLSERLSERFDDRLGGRLAERLSGRFDEYGISGKRPFLRKLFGMRRLSNRFGDESYDGYFSGRTGNRFDGFDRSDLVKAALLKKRASGSGRNRWFRFAIVGAALIYYFDPNRGRLRRSRIRDKLMHARNVFQSGMNKTGHDIGNRTRGKLASFRSFFRSRSQPVNDEVLAQRVRSHLGRLVSNPGAIEVAAQDGRVTLRGPALAREIGQLIMHVYAVRGVKEVENRLDSHDEPGRIPGLQGERTFRGARGGILQSSWSPTARAVAGTVGTLAFLYGISSPRNRWARRSKARLVPAVAGSLLAARAISNMELSRLTGIGARRRAIDVQKTIHINAPVQRVFALWSDFENFPNFMSHVRQVRRQEGESGRQGRQWRWTVDGPAGTKVEFDAGIVAHKNDRLIAWSTDRSSPIQHLGRIEFSDEGDGSTTVKVRMSYNPIAGALGHAVARFFGADPKHQMDDDLARMKSYIETGKVPHDAAAQKSGAQQKSGTAARSH